MFGLVTNLTKAVVSIALAPVAIVADVIMLPVTADKIDGEAFGMTSKLLSNAAKNIDDATS